MSIHEALRFFKAVEADPLIRDAVGKLSLDSRLADLERIARKNGFGVAVDELREAFVWDTALRKVFYSRSSQE